MGAGARTEKLSKRLHNSDSHDHTVILTILLIITTTIVITIITTITILIAAAAIQSIMTILITMIMTTHDKHSDAIHLESIMGETDDIDMSSPSDMLLCETGAQFNVGQFDFASFSRPPLSNFMDMSMTCL